MSYIAFRDNPDINGKLTGEQQAIATDLSLRIDKISSEGQHADLCGCTDSWCMTRSNVENREAGSEETIAWLAAKGVLNLTRAWKATQ
jgi:hypothetical protein